MTSSRRTSSPAPGSAASSERNTAEPWVTPRFSARRSRWATPTSCSSRSARNNAFALSRSHSVLGGVGRGVAMTRTSVSAGISRNNRADGLRTPALPAMKHARVSCSSCARELRATWWATTWRRRIRVQRRRASPAPLVSRLARRTSIERPSASVPVKRDVSESTTSSPPTERPQFREPRDELAGTGPHRRGAEAPPHAPAEEEPPEERDPEREGGQGIDRHPGEQDPGAGQHAPTRPPRTPGQIAGDEECDERGVEDQDRRVAAVEHGPRHGAVLPVPDAGGDDPHCRRLERGGDCVAGAADVRAQQRHEGDHHQRQASDGGRRPRPRRRASVGYDATSSRRRWPAPCCPRAAPGSARTRSPRWRPPATPTGRRWAV